MSVVGDNLIRLRSRDGLTRKQVVDSIREEYDISDKTYAAHEQGTNEPNIHALITYSNLFGVTIDQLVKEKIKITKTAPDGE